MKLPATFLGDFASIRFDCLAVNFAALSFNVISLPLMPREVAGRRLIFATRPRPGRRRSIYFSVSISATHRQIPETLHRPTERQLTRLALLGIRQPDEITPAPVIAPSN